LDFLLLVLLPHGLNHQLALSLVESVLLVQDCVSELILEFIVGEETLDSVCYYRELYDLIDVWALGRVFLDEHADQLLEII
jgi:hypothetical protein